MDIAAGYKNKNILITGGLGMIGSTIANILVGYGANVTIVDACIEPYGANIFNVKDIKDKITINYCDIRDKEAFKVLVKDKDVIFNLAGQVSHNDSLIDPYLDSDINYIGHLNVLESLKNHNKDAVIVYSGSRLQYGKIESIPVDENHNVNPRTPYALNKMAAENMYGFYGDVHDIKSVRFRIANPYGIRSQMKHCKYSMINWFIQLAMKNEEISIFGEGDQIRDYIYVEDLCNGLIAAAIEPQCYGETFNIGSGIGTEFKDMVNTVTDVVGSGTVKHVPWPENYINVETGDYISNINKLQECIDWVPEYDLKKGIEKTYNYYEKYLEMYK